MSLLFLAQFVLFRTPRSAQELSRIPDFLQIQVCVSSCGSWIQCEQECFQHFILPASLKSVCFHFVLLQIARMMIEADAVPLNQMIPLHPFLCCLQIHICVVARGVGHTSQLSLKQLKCWLRQSCFNHGQGWVKQTIQNKLQ